MKYLHVILASCYETAERFTDWGKNSDNQKFWSKIQHCDCSPPRLHTDRSEYEYLTSNTLCKIFLSCPLFTFGWIMSESCLSFIAPSDQPRKLTSHSLTETATKIISHKDRCYCTQLKSLCSNLWQSSFCLSRNLSVSFFLWITESLNSLVVQYDILCHPEKLRRTSYSGSFFSSATKAHCNTAWGEASCCYCPWAAVETQKQTQREPYCMWTAHKRAQTVQKRCRAPMSNRGSDRRGRRVRWMRMCVMWGGEVNLSWL